MGFEPMEAINLRGLANLRTRPLCEVSEESTWIRTKI